MRGSSAGQETRKLTVVAEWEADSLRRFIDDAARVLDAVNPTGSRGGAPSASASVGTGLAAPPPPAGGDLVAGATSVTVPLQSPGSGPSGGGVAQIPVASAPGGPSGIAAAPSMSPGIASASNISIGSATTITISAGQVNVSGGGGGGGTPLAPFAQGGGGGGAAQYLQNFRLGTVLGGGGGAGSAVMGNLLNELMPYAPYAVPALLGGAAIQSGWQYVRAQREFGLQIGQVGVATAAGERPDVGLSAMLQINQERAQNSFYEAMARSGIVNALSFGLSSNAIDNIEAERKMRIQDTQADAYALAREKSVRLRSPEGAQIAKEIAEYREDPYKWTYNPSGQVTPGMGIPISGPGWSRQLDLEQKARDQANSYIVGSEANVLGPYTRLRHDPAYRDLKLNLVGSDPNSMASNFDSTMMPILQSLMGLDFARMPGAFGAMRTGDFSGAMGYAPQAAGLAALHGDISGVTQVASLLMAIDNSGKLLDKAMEGLQASLEREKESRVAQNTQQFYAGQGNLQETAQREYSLTGRTASSSPFYNLRIGSAQAEMAAVHQQALKAAQELAQAQAMPNPDPEAIGAARAKMMGLLAQEEQLRMQPTMIRRERTEDIYRERQASIQASQAEVERGITTSTFYGSPAQIADAERKRLGILNEQVDAEQTRLDSLKRAGATPQERADAESRITDLLKQREQAEREIAADAYRRSQQVLGYQQTAATTSASITRQVYGSEAASGQTSTALGLQRESLSNMMARRDALLKQGVDPRNPQLAELNAQIEQARSEQLSSVSSLDFQPSYGVRSNLRTLGVYQAITQNLPSGYGDVRGTYEAQIGLAGQQLGELQKTYQARLKDASAIGDPRQRKAVQDALKEQFDQTRMGIFMDQMLPAERYLESDWQDRLVSTVIGANRNMSTVSNLLTKREGSLFYGVVNRAFGGDKELSDMFRKRGSLLYRSMAGSNASSEGIIDTAMSGVRPQVSVRFAPLPIDIIIRYPDGTIAAKSREQAEVRRQTQASDDPGNSAFNFNAG